MAYVGRVVVNGIEARDKLIKGANFLADSVKSTLGPFGRNFMIEKGLRVTNDGLKVASELALKDEIEDLGLRVLREATTKTNDEAGDGTTTATTLAQAILKACLPYLESVNVLVGKKTPAEIVRQIETERKEVTAKLVAMATPILTRDDLISSANVAVEDLELGTLIGGGQWDIGTEGVLIAEETAERMSYLEPVKGMRFDNGFGTSQLINNQEKQRMEVDEVRVILTNYTLRDLEPIKAITEQLIKTGSRKIAIIARAFTENAIQACMMNIQKGIAEIYPINAPYTDQNEVMLDLAAITGATYFNIENSDLSAIQLSDVGYASKIVCGRTDAVVAGKSDETTEERINARVALLTGKLAGSKSEFEKKLLESRIGMLTNGFGVVKIGSTSDVERKRLYDKAEDAVNAVRAALQEGTVPGAGLAFKTISESLPDTYLLKRPLMCIYEQIMATAPEGFVIEDWVRDPVKVLRIALEKACSVAGTFATAAGAVATEREKPKYVSVDNNAPAE